MTPKRPYPDVIDQAELDRQAHVPTETILQDLLDTREEIARLKLVEQGERLIAENSLHEWVRQTTAVAADARPRQVQEREEFAAYLERLLRARGYTYPTVRPMGAV